MNIERDVINHTNQGITDSQLYTKTTTPFTHTYTYQPYPCHHCATHANTHKPLHHTCRETNGINANVTDLSAMTSYPTREFDSFPLLLPPGTEAVPSLRSPESQFKALVAGAVRKSSKVSYAATWGKDRMWVSVCRWLCCSCVCEQLDSSIACRVLPACARVRVCVWECAGGNLPEGAQTL